MSTLRLDLTEALRDPQDGVQLESSPSRFWQRGFAELAPQLERLRDEVCDIDMRMVRGEIPTPDGKRPLHAGFYSLPEQLLADYVSDRRGSEMARILAVTKRLMTEVDRIVVVGAQELLLGPRAILDACCQPFFNELSRGDRGSRPRLYFVDQHSDNDRMQGLLHLLQAHRGKPATSIDESWGLVAIGNDEVAIDTIDAMKHLFAALQVNCGGDRSKLTQRVIGISTGGRPLTAVPVAKELMFEVAAGVGQRYSVLSAGGIVPAALMGINVMKLLEGARSINEKFRSEKMGANLVLQYAGANRLAENDHSTLSRQVGVKNRSLMAAGQWHRQLVARSLGCVLNYVAADTTSASVVHSHIDVEETRFDLLPSIEHCETRAESDGTQPPYGTQPDIEVEKQAAGLARSGLRATLTIPQVNDTYMGQFFQLVMLATVVEARLRGRNPYR